MTAPLVNAGSPQWEESYINLFDQPPDAFTVPNIDWNLNLDSFEGDHAVVGLDDTSPPSPHGISTGKSPETKTPERGSEPKAKKPKKGRPISSQNGEQSVADRRRTQVRLAQRAYRNRKETTVISLRKDVEDLKARLLGMEGIADELFEITYSAPYLPSNTIRKIQALHKTQENHRLPIQMRSSTQTHEDTTIPVINDTASSSPSSSAASVVSVNRKVLGGELRNIQSTAQYPNLDGYKSQPLPILDFFQSPQTLQSSITPSVSSFGIFNDSLLKFSMWLRHAALKGAYNLAEKPETPYQVLFEVFRYCIFSCTRDEILRHLEGLIQESAKTTYQNMVAMVKGGGCVAPDGHLSPLLYYTEAESVKRGVGDPYMGPEGVTNYLQERGLAIDPELSYAELTMSPGTLFGSVPSLFDEIRQQRKIRVSVEKLRKELLSRMVCLEVGPGIRVSKINEAIQSTVISVM